MDDLLNEEFFENCCKSYCDELFQLYGKSNKGLIDVEQFKSLTTGMTLHLSNEEYEGLFEKFQDPGNPQKVNFEGFMQIIIAATNGNLTFDSATLHQELKKKNIKLSYKMIERMVRTHNKQINYNEFMSVMQKIKHYWEEFQIFDLNKDGLLDFGEMIKALEKYSKVNNVHAVIDETKRRFSDVDINRDGCIDFSEFIDMIEMKQVNGTHAVLAFTQIDVNGDGYISKDELVAFLQDIGEEDSQESAKKMISFVDKNLDNKVSFHEFQKIFQHI